MHFSLISGKMNSLIIIGGLVLVIVWLTYRLGVTRIKLDQAKNAINTYERYEKINSKPDIDNPFERMRED